MPSEIRNNSRYLALPVDILSPIGGAARNGSESDSFDSLLRSLAPPQKPGDSNVKSSDRQRDESQFGATDSLAATARKPSDRDGDGRRDAVESQNGSERAATARQESDDRVRQSDESANAGDDPNDTPDSAIDPTPTANCDSKNEVSQHDLDDSAVAGELSSDVESKLDDDADEAAVLDPTAAQVSVLAAQAPPPVENGRTTAGVEQPNNELKEVAATVGLQATEPKAKVEPVIPPAASGEKCPVERVAEVERGDEKGLEVDTLVAAAQQASSVEGDAAELPVAAESDGASVADPIALSDLHSTKAAVPRTSAEEQPVEVATETAGDPTAEGLPTEVSVETADPINVSDRSESKVDSLSNSQQRGEAEQNKNDQSLDSDAQTLTEPDPESVAVATADTPHVDAVPKQSSEPTQAQQDPSPQTAQPTFLDAPARSPGTPRLAAELLAGGTREATHARPIEIDSARFLTRVARAFSAAQQRGGEVTLRLSPPELGSLRVEVKILDGVMTARVETENAAAQTAVLEHLPQLRERLAEQNVRIERFDVDLMQDGSSGTPDRSADRQAEPVPRPRTLGNSQPQNRKDAVSGRPAASGVSPSGGLNVIV